MPRDTVEEFHLLFAETQKAPSPAASDDVLRLLRALREYHSDPAHWCNSGMGEWPESACIIAGSNFLGGNVGVPEGWPRVEEHICAALPADSNGIVLFNEYEGRTHDELMALYDRAISSRLAEIEG